MAKVDLVGVALCGGEETAMVLVCSGLGAALRTDLIAGSEVVVVGVVVEEEGEVRLASDCCC